MKMLTTGSVRVRFPDKMIIFKDAPAMQEVADGDLPGLRVLLLDTGSLLFELDEGGGRGSAIVYPPAGTVVEMGPTL